MEAQSVAPSIVIRPSKERGHSNHGWLDSYFSFSFSDYYDPKHMHFRSLRVINEDKVAPGTGFDTHPHQNMEIFTYIVEGQLKHRDSMGHESVIKAGDVQKISAGSGIAHSEHNASDKDLVHLLQIWILPQEKNIKPSYQEMTLAKPKAGEALALIAAPKVQANVVGFNQDVYIYRGLFSANQEATYDLKSGRGVWVQMVKGTLDINGHVITTGDGVAIEHVTGLKFKAQAASEFLLFDLA